MANPWEMNWNDSSVPAQTTQYTGGQTTPNGIQVPWANKPPKEQLDWQQKAYEAGKKRLEDIRSITSQGSDVLNQLNAFGEYNKGSRTGAAYEGGWLSSLMPEGLRGQDERNMQSITADLAPKKRIAGSGTTSDKDISLYMQSLPGIDKPGEVNHAIRLQYQNQYDNALAKQTFMEDWLNKYHHLEGADTYWANNKSKLGWKPVPTITEVQSKLTKGQKQGKLLQDESNKSVFNAADAIVEGK